MKQVTSHYEVDSGDFLLYERVNGNTKVSKMEAKDEDSALREVARLMNFYFIHHAGAKVELEISIYDSPLRQKIVRGITIK